MRTVGFVLVAIGALWALIAFNMETTTTASVGSVYNVGLLANRITHLIGAGVLFLAGVILLAAKSGQSAQEGNEKRTRVELAVVIGIVFLSLVGLLLYGVLVSDRADREALPSPLIGKPAPSFELPMLHQPGRLFSSQELHGQPYLLNVWGSWCPGCRVEHPVITRFAETRRVRVVGYNWKDEHADAMRWLEQFGNPYWLVLVDYDGRKAIDWGIYGAPETFLVDAEGIVRWKHVGPVDDTVIAESLGPVLDEMGVAK